MKNEFSRIITKLRKQKGLSQKDAAKELGISQSLLSHYEKGIRECGLEFLVKTADYYDVSVDYLLGRTNSPNLPTNESDGIPDVDELRDVNNVKSNTYCLLNRKLLLNSTAVIYSLLAQTGNKKLNRCVTDYLMIAEYNIIRKLYSLKENNPNDLFTITDGAGDRFCDAALTLLSARIESLRKSGSVDGIELSQKKLAEMFDDSYTSLHQVIVNAEKVLNQNFKL